MRHSSPPVRRCFGTVWSSRPRESSAGMNQPIPESPDYAIIHGDIVTLLEVARRAAARSVNALMTASYWEIGRRIVEFEQAGQDRAGYGDVLIERLSSDLSSRFGRGFSRQNLQQMRQFYQAWPSDRIRRTAPAKSPAHRIRQTLSGECAPKTSLELTVLAQAFSLPWSAYVRLLSVKNPQARTFYESEALRCGWLEARRAGPLAV
ncbi:conserved hypothetical protein [Cupriavidus necator]|uniref:YhcG N-terminal domain-containing protein n=1 Tax=Cupriavidus necator TaxID=106590 RepID=A0A1K0J9D7_CUPNE|nr:conserved hypothetical protein [Cupriavidus necator]